MDEEQTVSEKKRREKPQAFRKNVRHRKAAPEETVQVYICGAVRFPRCLHAAAGSRVVQAVEAACGFCRWLRKNPQSARKIEDGEQITVWTREEAENMESTETPQQNTAARSRLPVPAKST